MSKIFDIMILISIIFSVLYIGDFMYKEAWKESKYKQAKINIDETIKSNMSQAEIHNIIEIHCQSVMNTESNIYYCITKYEIEN